MRVANENLLVIDGAAATTSLAASQNMKPVWLGHIADFSIQLVFTGTPAGTFKLQASNDTGKPQSAGDAAKYSGVTNWTDIADSDVTVSAAGNIMWNYQDAGFEWVRVIYTASGAGSGSPTLTVARAKVKGI